jgi:hypothetical protein
MRMFADRAPKRKTSPRLPHYRTWAANKINRVSPASQLHRSFDDGTGDDRMSRARIGELLSRIVPLSGHDVEEILEEQSSNRRRFGEIALSWGLCRPEHVWDAWCQQSSQEGETLDLERIGVDTRAASLLPAEVARRYEAIPVRVTGDMALVAMSHNPTDAESHALSVALHRKLKFARADHDQMLAMIERYYPPASATG